MLAIVLKFAKVANIITTRFFKIMSMDEQKQQTLSPITNKVIKWVSGVMAAIGASTLGVMMLLSVADVIGRYFFLKPIHGFLNL